MPQPVVSSAWGRSWFNCVVSVRWELDPTEGELREWRSSALPLSILNTKSPLLRSPYWTEITIFMACFYWQQFCWQSAAWGGRKRHLTQKTIWAIGIMLLPWTTSTGMLWSYRERSSPWRHQRYLTCIISAWKLSLKPCWEKGRGSDINKALKFLHILRETVFRKPSSTLQQVYYEISNNY